MATLPRLSVCLYLKGARGCREISAGRKKSFKDKRKVVIFVRVCSKLVQYLEPDFHFLAWIRHTFSSGGGKGLHCCLTETQQLFREDYHSQL